MARCSRWRSSKGESHRAYGNVVCGVERRHGNFVSAADGESETMPKVKLPEYDARREIYDRIAVMLALVIVDEIDFRFGPDFLVNSVLKRVVPGQIASDGLLVSGGQADPQRSLHIEIPEALSVGNRRRDYRIWLALRVLSRGNAHLEESRQYVVSVLLVFREDSIFHQELPIAESVFGIRVVHDVGRDGQDDLELFRRNDFQTLAHAVVVRNDAAIVRLRLDVIPKLLFEPGSGRGEGSNPVGLLALRSGYHGEPILEETVRMNRGSGRSGIGRRCGCRLCLQVACITEQRKAQQKCDQPNSHCSPPVARERTSKIKRRSMKQANLY